MDLFQGQIINGRHWNQIIGQFQGIRTTMWNLFKLNKTMQTALPFETYEKYCHSYVEIHYTARKENHVRELWKTCTDCCNFEREEPNVSGQKMHQETSKLPYNKQHKTNLCLM